MVQKTVLHSLNSGMVLDRSMLVVLSADELSETIASIRAAGAKKLYVVDGADAFFTIPVLMGLIHTGDPKAGIVNEALGGFFTEQQIKALTVNLPAPHKVHVEAQQPYDDGAVVNLDKQPAQYIFAEVPAGWSIGANMSLGQTKIKRKIKSPEGDGTMFYMAPADFEKLWGFARKVWSGGGVTATKCNTGMGLKAVVVRDNHIVIGGNYVRRYEIEQVAKYRGWAMPGAMANAA